MDIEQRLQRLEDIEAIKSLKAKYFHACDQKQLDEIKSCFVAGEVFIDYAAIGTFNNADELLALFKDKACHPHIIDLHHGQNYQVEWLNENEASAVIDLYFYQINTEENTLAQLGGFYRDKFSKVNGKWKIAETIFTPTSTVVSVLNEGLANVVMAGKARVKIL
jgi:hypothetical protein